MKKLLAVGLSGVMAASACGVLAGCGGGGDTLEIWSFTNEMNTIVEMFKEDMNPDFEIKVTIADTGSHHNKLNRALGTSSAPDVFTVEYAYARSYLESGALMSLSADGFDMQTRAQERLYDYTVDFMTDSEGILRALSWQATPGAFFVRRSTAAEYFPDCVVDGELDLQKLQDEHFSTYAQFQESAETLYNASNGEVKILSSLDDARRIFLSNREEGWVTEADGATTLNIETQVLQYMDMAKFLQGGTSTEDKYINGQTEQQSGWFNDMANPNVFGYFLPTWGLHYYLKQHAEGADGYSAEGDWAVIPGPTYFVDGGTWLATAANTDMAEEAKMFMEYVIFNTDFLKEWAQSTGDFLSDKLIVEEIKDSMADPFLGGQNHYELFADIADDISIDYVSAYDNELDGVYKAQVVDYARGTITAQEALTNFVANVHSNHPAWLLPDDATIAELASQVEGSVLRGDADGGNAAATAYILKEI